MPCPETTDAALYRSSAPRTPFEGMREGGPSVCALRRFRLRSSVLFVLPHSNRGGLAGNATATEGHQPQGIPARSPCVTASVATRTNIPWFPRFRRVGKPKCWAGMYVMHVRSDVRIRSRSFTPTRPRSHTPWTEMISAGRRKWCGTKASTAHRHFKVV